MYVRTYTVILCSTYLQNNNPHLQYAITITIRIYNITNNTIITHSLAALENNIMSFMLS